MKNHSSKVTKVRLVKLLGTAIPLAALAVPGTVFAQQAVNTATIGVPAGATDSNSANNSATDTDTVFADLVATNDDFSVNPILSTGGITTSVFANDTLNGAIFTNPEVVVSILNNGGLTGVTVGTDGRLTVPSGASPGSYTITNQICEAANPTNCKTAEAIVLVFSIADLQTVKTLVSSTSEPGVGDTVTFQITVTNNGANDASNVTLTDSLPAGLTATGNNGFVTAGSYVAGTGVWTIPSLANGASATLTIEGTVDVGTEGSTITNTTTAATSDAFDPGTTGDDLDEAVTVINTIVAGDDDFSSTSVPSTGGNTVSVFTDDTINGAAFANGDVSASITNDGGLTGVSINADGTLTIPSGATPGSYTITYEICETADPDNCDTANVQVTIGGVADLRTVKTLASSTSEPGVGDTVTFQIVVTNNGGDTATNVTLTDSLPAGLTATVNNGDVTVGSYVAGTGVWTIPSLADGASATLTIEGTVNAGTEGSTITNTTTAATSDQTDPGTTGDDLDEAVAVINTIIANDNDFSSVSIPSTGGTTATVFGNDTLNGAGFADADVIASITNDGGLTGVSINADGTIDIPSGATPGSYSVTYQICEFGDPDNCDSATVTIVVGSVVDLSVTKDNGVTTVTSGDTITYTITVSNAGPDAATGAVLADTPGAGITCPTTNPLAFTGAGAPAGGPFTVDDLVNGGLTLGTIGNGQSLTVTYDCTVD